MDTIRRFSNSIYTDLKPLYNDNSKCSDSYILVVFKPPGVLSQDDTDEDGKATVLSVSDEDYSVVERARRYSMSDYAGLVHRLDRPVSGLMVLGKTPAAARALSGQL